MRLDRSLTLRLFAPLQRAGSAVREQRVPILMYHSISDSPEEGGHPFYRLSTSPRRFNEQMQSLSDCGQRGASVEQTLSTQWSSQESHARVVGITFDDGFRDFYTSAWPILQRYGFTATVYVPTSFVGGARRAFHGKDCLVWSEIRKLHAQGIQFGSHTVNHPDLRQLSWEAIRNEVASSRDCIEQELGKRVDTFAYPYAFPQEQPSFTSAFRDLLCEQGYSNCATSAIGRVRLSGELFYLKRLPVNELDDCDLFKAKLEGAYDWLGPFQRVRRTMKTRWPRLQTLRVSSSDLRANCRKAD